MFHSINKRNTTSTNIPQHTDFLNVILKAQK